METFRFSHGTDQIGPDSSWTLVFILIATTLSYVAIILCLLSETFISLLSCACFSVFLSHGTASVRSCHSCALKSSNIFYLGMPCSTRSCTICLLSVSWVPVEFSLSSFLHYTLAVFVFPQPRQACPPFRIITCSSLFCLKHSSPWTWHGWFHPDI